MRNPCKFYFSQIFRYNNVVPKIISLDDLKEKVLEINSKRQMRKKICQGTVTALDV
jgi:hypothetical protein